MWINTEVNARRREGGFHGYKAENVTTTTTRSESMHMQDGGGGGNLSLYGRYESKLPPSVLWEKQINDLL